MNSTPGRNNNTQRNSENTTAGWRSSGSQTTLTDSMTPMNSPAMSAHLTLPSPPKTTTTNISTMNSKPTVGETG